ncbi:MAG: insulinase family protein [Elusimicrobia bacterium]|nr:insulinase family protein [Elusimicrobiota bacterium]
MKEHILKTLILGSSLVVFASSLHAVKPRLPKSKPLAFSPPQGARYTLKNGMIVYILKDNTLPIINISAKIKTGKIYDTEDKIGLAELTADLLKDGGTLKYKPEEIDEILEFSGASISSRIFMEEGEVAMRCLSKDFKKVFNIYSDVLMNPTFNDDKLKLFKDDTLEGIRRRNDKPDSQAQREAIRMFYGKNHPYGWRTEPETIEAINKEDLKNFHSNFYKPNNIILAVSGDFKNEKEILENLNTAFSSWKQGKVNFPVIPEAKIKAERNIYFIEKDIAQTFIVLIQKGIKRHDPIEFPLSVANQILGGGSFSSRLTNEIRTKRGLAYTVYSYFAKRPDYGYFFAYCGTKPETYSQALEEMLKQFQLMKEKTVSAKELNIAKSSIINSFVFRFPTPFSLMEERASYELYGYSKDYLDNYTKEMAKTTQDSVLEASKKILDPDNAMLFVIGNSKKFDKPLSTFGKVTVLKED